MFVNLIHLIKSFRYDRFSKFDVMPLDEALIAY